MSVSLEGRTRLSSGEIRGFFVDRKGVPMGRMIFERLVRDNVELAPVEVSAEIRLWPVYIIDRMKAVLERENTTYFSRELAITQAAHDAMQDFKKKGGK